jgi:hypothetical protein
LTSGSFRTMMHIEGSFIWKAIYLTPSYQEACFTFSPTNIGTNTETHFNPRLPFGQECYLDKG